MYLTLRLSFTHSFEINYICHLLSHWTSIPMSTSTHLLWPSTTLPVIFVASMVWPRNVFMQPQNGENLRSLVTIQPLLLLIPIFLVWEGSTFQELSLFSRSNMVTGLTLVHLYIASAKSDIYFAALFYLDYINDLNLLEKKLLREFDMLKLFLRKLEILSIFK